MTRSSSLPGGSHAFATLNVGTLSGRLPEVLALVARLGIVTLCLQETRVHPDSWDAVRRAFGHQGYIVHFGEALPGPSAVGGLLVATRLPACPFPLPDSPLLRGRAMALRVAPPQGRPFVLANFHGQLDSYNAGHAASLLLDALGSSGDPWILAGDHNRLQEQWPYSAAFASGLARAWDEFFLSQPHCGTRRNPAGHYTRRTIDFMLSHPSLAPLSREQVPGPGDHDVVAYSLPGFGPLPHTACWRRCAPLTPSPDPVFSLPAAFDDAVSGEDLDLAWSLLSCAAEAALGAQGPATRAAEPRLCLRDPMGSSRAPRCQSLLERKLRRLARRTAALADCSNHERPGLLSNIASLTADLPPSVAAALPLGPEVSVHSASSLHAAADALSAKCAKDRLARWKLAVQDDIPRLASWIKRDPPASPAGPPLSDAAQAEFWASEWESRWKAGFTDLAALDRLSSCLPRLPPADLQVTAEQLRAAVLKASRTAPGLDQWAPAHWRHLPLAFFEALAALWRRCLDLGRLPAPWRHVRIALVPKPDGSRRPIAIAALAYRAVMTASMRALRPWILSWVPAASCGGVPARHPGLLHDRLFGAMSLARSHHRDLFCGTKADVRRCFDSMDFEVTFRVFARLGAPPGLTAVLRHFYSVQLRWFSTGGTVHPTPVSPERGLLQGCPASPCLLNATMTLWVLHVALRAPSVHTGVYLDDRTLWTVGEASADPLCAAVRAGAEVDAAAGTLLHPDKLGCFALSPVLRRQLVPLSAELGPVTTSPRLLGIQYFFGGRALCAPSADIDHCVAHRCRKIAKAGRSLKLRRFLVVLLVVSLFRWTGPWHRYTAKATARWATQVEQALCGDRLAHGRSTLLLWGALGSPEAHPGFALHFEALRHAWRAAGTPVALLPCPRLQAALGFFSWTCPEPGVWSTPFGSLRLGWDSETSLRLLATRSWHRVLWTADKKTSLPLAAGVFPSFAAHRAAPVDSDPYLLRVLVGTAADARTLERATHSNDTACACGHPVATRTHLTFHCDRQPWSHDLRSEAERRLMLPLLHMQPARLDPVLPPHTLLAFLSSQLRLGVSRVCLALDGGCLDPSKTPLVHRSAWAIVSVDGSFTCGSALYGADQSAAYAERTALWHAVAAAHQVGIDIALLIDNQAVVRRLQRGLTGSTAGDAALFWHQLLDRWRPSSRVAWIPSHDKQPAWRPPPNFPDTATCRRANACADAEVTQLLAPARPSVQLAASDLASATSWTQRCHSAQRVATLPFWEACKASWFAFDSWRN